MAGALDGIKVIELGQEIQGPYAALFLADMGADVIKVENRESGDLARQMTVARIAGEELPHGDFQQFFFLLNRGKRSLTLDLKQDEGKEVLRRLLDGADVLLTNFRPGVLDRLGFSYEHLHERFPRLIHATASSWGPRGPWARRPSRDMLAQAAAGIMTKTGLEGQPPLPAGFVAADYSGAVFSALGILTALYARERTGTGQKVDTSMYGALLALQPWELIQASITGRENRRAGRGHQFLNGAWGAFRTSDGWIAIAGIEDSRWPSFCAAINRPDLVDDPQYDGESRNFAGERIHRLLDQVLLQRTTDQWLEVFQAADLFVTAVADYDDVLNSEQALENGYIRWAEHPPVGRFKMVGPPIELSETPFAEVSPAPALGEHTVEILRELGFDDGDIDRLQRAKTI